MYHRVEEELVFVGTWFLQKGIPGKVPLKKRDTERNSFFLQELGSDSLEFLELENQKKGMQIGTHNLAFWHIY
jgi:hypothetical protein